MGVLNGVKGVFSSNYVESKDDPHLTPPTASYPSAGQGATVLPKPMITNSKVIATYAHTKENLSMGDLKVMTVTSTYYAHAM